MRTLKGNYIGTTAVTQCVNSKPFACSNICETAGGESHCQSLLLSYKKFCGVFDGLEKNFEREKVLLLREKMKIQNMPRNTHTHKNSSVSKLTKIVFFKIKQKRYHLS